MWVRVVAKGLEVGGRGVGRGELWEGLGYKWGLGVGQCTNGTLTSSNRVTEVTPGSHILNLTYSEL